MSLTISNFPVSMYDIRYRTLIAVFLFINLVLVGVSSAELASLPSLKTLDKITNVNLSVAFLVDSVDFPALDVVDRIGDRWGRSEDVRLYKIPQDVYQKQTQLIHQLNIHMSPSFVLFYMKNKKLTIQKHIEGHDFTEHKINLALAAFTEETTVKLTKDIFYTKVQRVHNKQRPHLVLFYTHWSAGVLRYLNAFQSTSISLSELNSTIVPSIIDIHEHHTVLTEYLPEYNAKMFPFILYFYPLKVKHTVESMRYIEYNDMLPTPLNVVEFLDVSGQPLQDLAGNTLKYQPAGKPPIDEYTRDTEGPFGYECSLSFLNTTDTEPHIREPWLPPRVLIIKPYKAPRDWFSVQPVDLAVIQSKLEISHNGIPMLTTADWHDVIEKSHRHDNPFSQAHVKEEATQVSIVIFVKESCDFCVKSLETFESIYRSTLKIEQAHVYLMNCSNGAQICEKQKVKGYPTLAAYRSISWLHHAKCLSAKTGKKLKYARHDYHGLMMVKPVMDWIIEVTQPAVQLLHSENEKTIFHKLDTDAHLVAVMTPRESSHLPARKLVAGGKRSERYPLECYRLICERLYGMVGCAAEYHYKMSDKDIKSASYSSLIITHIELHRRDGLETTVMELDRSFLMLMNSESDNTIHSLHPPHRYRISDSQTCEQDHSVCTDHIVQYTLDHARLAVSTLDTRTFHTHQGMVGNANLPLLVAFVHPENITEGSLLSQILHEAAIELYTDFRVVTVDVMQYHFWANRVVPKHYSIDSVQDGGFSWLYLYPRFSIITMDDHNHAAFYPEINNSTDPSLYNFTRQELVTFSRRYLKNPAKLLVETEMF